MPDRAASRRGPGAAQYLVLGAKARSIFGGRLNVTCDDIRQVARPVFRHRLFTNFTADAEGITAEKIVERLLAAVPEPAPESYRARGATGGLSASASGPADSGTGIQIIEVEEPDAKE